MEEVDGFLDRETLESLLATLDNLARAQKRNLWCAKDRGLELDGYLFDLKTPVMHSFLSRKLVDHLLDLFDLILWSDPCHSQGISHASTFANGIGHTIEQAEF